MRLEQHDAGCTFTIILAFVLVELVREYTIAGSIEIDSIWLAIAGVGTATWVVLKTLNKFAKVLRPAAVLADG